MGKLSLQEIEEMINGHEHKLNLRDHYVNKAFREAVEKHVKGKDGIPDYTKLPDHIDDVINEMKDNLKDAYKLATGVDYNSIKGKDLADKMMGDFFGMDWLTFKNEVIKKDGDYSGRDFAAYHNKQLQQLQQDDIISVAHHANVKDHFEDFKKYISPHLTDNKGKIYGINKDRIDNKMFAEMLYVKATGQMNHQYLKDKEGLLYKQDT